MKLLFVKDVSVQKSKAREGPLRGTYHLGKPRVMNCDSVGIGSQLGDSSNLLMLDENYILHSFIQQSPTVSSSKIPFQNRNSSNLAQRDISLSKVLESAR